MNPIPKTFLFFLLGLMGLVSCVEDSHLNADDPGSAVLDTLTSPAPPLLSFHDVIPEEFSDSTKTEIITRLVGEINQDSSLFMIQVQDSLNRRLFGYYRNDSLVKMRLGLGGHHLNSEIERPVLLSGRLNQYYFHSDSLIFSEYHCSSWQQTGRCSPVSISVWTWFYEREVISQEMDENIGPYGGCGCGFGFGFGHELYTYNKQIDELLAIVKLAKHDAAMQGKEGE